MDITSLDPADFVPLATSAFVGSFLGVLIKRLPRGTPICFSRSRCESCHTPLAPRDLVPMLSYAVSLGHCRHCGVRITSFYWWIELTAVCVALSAMLVFSGIELWLWCLLGWGLLALAWIDAEWMVLPDCLTLPLLAIGLGAGSLIIPESLIPRLAGAIAGWGLFAGVTWGYRLLRGHDGLGGGDAKLLAVAGAWLGIGMLPYVMMLSASGAAIWALAMRTRGGGRMSGAAIPFGPWLAASIWLVGLTP